MNKYDKILKMLGRIFLGLAMILLVGVLFGIGAPVVMCMEMGVLGIWIGFFTVPIGGFMAMQGINVMIFNQPYRNTGYVKGGQSTIEAINTLEYTKLSMWFCFFGFLIFTCVAIFCLVYAITHGDYKRIISIILCVVSIIYSVIYFLMAGRRKLNIKHDIDIEKQ